MQEQKRYGYKLLVYLNVSMFIKKYSDVPPQKKNKKTMYSP